MSTRRRRRAGSSTQSLRFESLETRRLLAGDIQLGPQTGIFDQPYVQVELRDGETIIGPTGSDEFGLYQYNRLLLDTGANGIIAVNDVVTDMVVNGYVTEGEYEELGVSGVSQFDVSAAYEFRYQGSDEVVHTLPQTADDVRIMTNPTMTFGARVSEGGIGGIAGMPLMAGRVTTLDMRQWNEEVDLFSLNPLGVTFTDELPPDPGNRYSVALDTRIVFDPRDGLPEGSPPDAPLPSWAPITFFDVTPKFQGTSVTGGFLLDTGAQLSMISNQMAFDLGLDENGDGSVMDEAVLTLPIVGVGGTIDIPLLVIDEISIPTEQGDLITFGSGDGEDDYIVVAVHDVAPGIDGIFGADLLTSGLDINLESPDFEFIGNPYFNQIHMDFRDLVTQGQGRLYLDVNPAPVLWLQGTSESAVYTENEPATFLVSSATVTDSDSPDLDSGAVTATITDNATPGDRLEIIPGDGFSLAGDDVSYNGVVIGAASGGEVSTPLVIDLNGEANTELAAALIARIGFRSTSDLPSTAERTIEFAVIDGDGNQSKTPTQTTVVVDINDAPESESASLEVDEDGASGVLAGSDADGDPLTYTLLTAPAHGTLTGTAPNLIYTPNANYYGPDSFSFKLNDGALDSAVANINFTVLPVNDAPVLDATLSPKLATIAEDSPSPASTLVSTLLANAVADPDAGAQQGIAITWAPTSAGVWQFSLDDGTTWQSIGALSQSAALLLPESARIRLLPKLDFNGTVAITYLAWDQTQGASGSKLSVLGNTGEAAAFSTQWERAPLTVKAVNDVPVIAMSGSATYRHDSAAFLLAPFATVSDVDSPDFAGGRLRVRIDLASSTNRLIIGGNFTIDANNNVLLAGVIIGQRTSNGFGTKDLIVTFNSKATRSVVQQLVRAIAFKTVAGSAGTRTVFFSVSDGDGGLSPEATKVVNVT